MIDWYSSRTQLSLFISMNYRTLPIHPKISSHGGQSKWRRVVSPVQHLWLKHIPFISSLNIREWMGVVCITNMDSGNHLFSSKLLENNRLKVLFFPSSIVSLRMGIQYFEWWMPAPRISVRIVLLCFNRWFYLGFFVCYISFHSCHLRNNTPLKTNVSIEEGLFLPQCSSFSF